MWLENIIPIFIPNSNMYSNTYTKISIFTPHICTKIMISLHGYTSILVADNIQLSIIRSKIFSVEQPVDFFIYGIYIRLHINIELSLETFSYQGFATEDINYSKYFFHSNRKIVTVKTVLNLFTCSSIKHDRSNTFSHFMICMSSTLTFSLCIFLRPFTTF